MLKFLKKIYTILVLLANFFIRKQNYILTFIREEFGVWYYDFKGWGFDKEHLLMVSGADKLCDAINVENKDKLTVRIKASKKPLLLNSAWLEYKGEDLSKYKTFKDKFMYGRHYTATVNFSTEQQNLKKFWICPVTLFVLGRYPNYIYIRQI